VDEAARGAPDADVVRRLVRVPLLLLLLGARRRGAADGPRGAEAHRPEHVEVVPGGLGDVVVGRVEEVVCVEQVDGVVGEERGDVDVGVVGEPEGGFVGRLVELVLAEPVVAEPGGGLDELPPLGREVLHLAVRRRDEERRVRVQRRRRHGHGAHPPPLHSSTAWNKHGKRESGQL